MMIPMDKNGILLDDWAYDKNGIRWQVGDYLDADIYESDNDLKPRHIVRAKVISLQKFEDHWDVHFVEGKTHSIHRYIKSTLATHSITKSRKDRLKYMNSLIANIEKETKDLGINGQDRDNFLNDIDSLKSMINDYSTWKAR